MFDPPPLLAETYSGSIPEMEADVERGLLVWFSEELEPTFLESITRPYLLNRNLWEIIVMRKPKWSKDAAIMKTWLDMGYMHDMSHEEWTGIWVDLISELDTEIESKRPKLDQ